MIVQQNLFILHEFRYQTKLLPKTRKDKENFFLLLIIPTFLRYIACVTL